MIVEDGLMPTLNREFEVGRAELDLKAVDFNDDGFMAEVLPLREPPENVEVGVILTEALLLELPEGRVEL